ncbi:MAG: group II intron reverse transcriptase domain-containing protein [Lachnospiraceae bacterium]|nr:group II intron reverse transcriptase domain-containing protein [Lachnospiraceae bacterium]
MSLLDRITDAETWEAFYEYKLSLACAKQFTGELRKFIDEKRYEPVCEGILAGRPFPLPRRAVISKMGTDKRRIVYTYPQAENTVLKLLTWLILRKYDRVFCDDLYSFRPGRTAKDAVRRLLKERRGLLTGDAADRGTGPVTVQMYGYKVDIHDYFNSIPVERLLPMLKETLADDERLYEFLAALLAEPNVIDKGRVVSEQKGIMAGTPLSSFYANLYLAELDRHFAEAGVIYARYSDDIIVFAESEDEVRGHAEYIRGFLTERSLTVNPAKECYFAPGEGFVFLGFYCGEEYVDIAPATLKKLKQKMRRKRDALARWAKRNEVSGEKAAKAFIRMFNRKLLESPQDNELSWSSWFFPVINTAESLHEIDAYAQDCLRYLVSGRHTKKRFDVRYEDLKELGYKSLVHEYYEGRSGII